jgi:hypothetical protein
MCDQIYDLLLKNNYIKILDHLVKLSIQGRIYCKLHDSFKHNFENYNMFRQIVKSAIDKERLKFVETPRDDQSISIGPDGKGFLHRLLQANPFKHEKVKTTGEGIMLSSKQIIHEHNVDILECENSIKVKMKTPRTRGQQANPELDASKLKENKGRNKHERKKSKVTFAQLLDKYQKASEAKGAYRQTMQKHQDHPVDANLRTCIGKGRISMQHIHILILDCQCQCRGYLTMVM